tara:strand:- start:56 stop:211 length:156 start_codon:yes stop_codon:yes gene_type:complete
VAFLPLKETTVVTATRPAVGRAPEAVAADSVVPVPTVQVAEAVMVATEAGL